MVLFYPFFGCSAVNISRLNGWGSVYQPRIMTIFGCDKMRCYNPQLWGMRLGFYSAIKHAQSWALRASDALHGALNCTDWTSWSIFSRFSRTSLDVQRRRRRRCCCPHVPFTTFTALRTRQHQWQSNQHLLTLMPPRGTELAAKITVNALQYQSNS